MTTTNGVDENYIQLKDVSSMEKYFGQFSTKDII